MIICSVPQVPLFCGVQLEIILSSSACAAPESDSAVANASAPKVVRTVVMKTPPVMIRGAVMARGEGSLTRAREVWQAEAYAEAPAVAPIGVLSRAFGGPPKIICMTPALTPITVPICQAGS